MRSDDELLMVVRRRASRLRSARRRRWGAATVAALLVGGVGMARATGTDERVQVLPATDHTTTTTSPATTTIPLGEALARVRIEAIDIDVIVVEGVGAADLKKGPGHYPGTPLPGHEGNAALAGHRTTYGAPFNRLDELRPGDRIEVTTAEGTAIYEVRETITVEPSEVEVLSADFWANRHDGGLRNALTLTTPDPKYSNAQRLVVGAELVSSPFPGEAANGNRPDELAPLSRGGRPWSGGQHAEGLGSTTE